MTGMDTRTAAARELPLTPDDEVAVTVAAGSLRLRATDDPVVRVRTLDDGPLDEAVTIGREDGRVSITGREEGLRLGPVTIGRGRPVDLEIQLPRLAAVNVRTASGDVDARGLAGPSRWTTMSGDLALALDGGAVAIRTVSGDVVLEASAAISLEARTVSGGLIVRAPRLLGLQLESTSGDVELDGELDAGGAHDIGTVSGDVAIATDSPVRLETRTVAGDVESSVPHRTEGSRGQRTIVVGPGSVRVSVRTMSGDIALRARGTRDGSDGERRDIPEVAFLPPVPPLPAPTVPAPPLAAPPPAALPSAPVPPAAPATLGDDATDRREAARLEVLRALERGEIDIDAASHRLEVLEEAGPRFFRGWV